MAFALGLGLGLILVCLWVLVGGASVVQAQGPDGYDVYYVAPSCAGVPVPCYTSVQDAGVSDDIDGDPRPVGGGYDIGADERRESETFSVYLPLVLKHYP